ncbi:ATP-binding cassette sub-family A member 7-like isoform X2 [Varroa destructor]|uniref:ABC transporter domain-containing protein n=1 Tax=Varroa destructor TaxID=109461 RepID=A0A7M7K3D6_VARDE|nr:ATP-binding cassette sub-family A member 7-like isoform X2 [Varroa destructor]
MNQNVVTLSDLESTVLGTTAELDPPNSGSDSISTTVILPSNATRQLYALYRKDFIISKWKRHYIVSTFELGLLTLLIVTVVRELGEAAWEGPKKYPVQPALTSIDFATPARKLLQSNISQIAYAPKTRYTDTVLLNAFKDAKPPPVFHGFDNGDNFRKYMESSNRTSFLLSVLFDYKTAIGLYPQNFNYSLRFNSAHYEFYIKKKFAKSSEKPRTQFITEEETLLLWPSMNALFRSHLAFHGLEVNESGVERTGLSPSPNIKYFPTARYSVSTSTRLENIGFVTSMGCSFFLLFFVLGVIREKRFRAKELLCMMGVSEFVYRTNLFLVGFTTKAILVLIAWVLTCFPIFGKALYSASNKFVVLAFLMLYAVAIILQSLLITVPFTSPAMGVIGTLVISFVSMVLSRELSDPELSTSRYKKLHLSLLPEVGLELGCDIIGSWERAGIGAQWTNIAERAEPENISLLDIITMMVISCALYAFLAFYLDSVLPWQQGIPKHPLFLCQRTYWCPPQTDEDEDDLSGSVIEDSAFRARVFEKEPSNLGRPAIEFRRIVHQYHCNDKPVLDNLSLKLYRDQITVIIGHNGSGKTTALSILAGLFPPKSGEVFINNYNVRTNTNRARRGVGLCPQQNVIFDELTVKENLEFFLMIKGANEMDAETEINKILFEVNLEAKQDVQASKLTTEMKRKLCMAHAMIGGSNILILDEPTTGLDPEGRRQIWTILEKARNGRTILMTTHHMDEADVLGDRVAFLSYGKLKCVGSPLFLKNLYETGYKLRCIKTNIDVDVQPTLHIVKGHLGRKQVQLTSDIGLEFCINLGTPDAIDLIQLFRDLEESRQRLGIGSLGVSITTMEDVFLKVDELQDSEKPSNECSLEPFPNCVSETGWTLYRSQFWALFLKRVHLIRRQWSMLIFLIVLPCLLTGYVALQIEAVLGEQAVSEALLLNYSFPSLADGRSLEGFIQNMAKSPTTNKVPLIYAMEQHGIKVNHLNVGIDIDNYLLEIAKTQPLRFKERWQMGGTSNLSGLKDDVLWFNAEPYHVGATALARWQTAVLYELTQSSNSLSKNLPVGVHVTNELVGTPPLHFSSVRILYIRTMTFLLIQLATSLLVSPVIFFPIEERVTKSRLMQKMSGVHGTIFYGASLFFDFIVMLVCSFLVTLVLAVCNPAESLRIQTDASAAIWLLLIEYGFAMIKIAYMLAYWFNSPWTGFTAMVAGTALIAGVIVPIVTFIIFLGNIEKIGAILNYVPQFAVVWGFSNIQLNVHSKKICESLSNKTLITFCVSPLRIDACCQLCSNQTSSSVYCYERKSSFSVVVDQMYALFSVSLIASIVLIVLETCIQRGCNAPKCLQRMRRSATGKMLTSHLTSIDHFLFLWKLAFIFTGETKVLSDADVLAEQRKVRDAVRAGKQANYALLAHDLTKDYGLCYSFRAVDHVSFAVKKNENFGLLGVNGAGKTTIFGMLTGDLTMSDGNAYISHSDLRSSRTEYQSYVGFCPQVDDLLGGMSGQEMLELFCALRGVRSEQRASLIALIVTLADLEPYADKLISTYSGGNKRKLAIALAMIGNLPVICLDKPTSGIDPAARRKIWAMLAKAQRELGTSIILSSHSMDECETLCGRMAIIVNGTFRCLGSSQHIRGKFAQGYTLTIKVRPSDDDATVVSDICALMDRLFSMKNQLTDVHQNTLTYYIKDPNLRWSELFEVVKELQEQFSLEDSVVSDTSLEQIFLAFAATQAPDESIST